MKFKINQIWLFILIMRSFAAGADVDTIYDVIVVGGGVSGLSACEKLAKSGYKNILLIEASNRLGGRVNTIQYGNNLIELGAQWIHGKIGNPVYELMYNLDEVDSQTIFFTGETIHSSFQNGIRQSESQVDYINMQIKSLFSGISTNGLPTGTSSNDNFGNVIDRLWKDLLIAKLQTYDPNLLNAVYKAYLDDMKSDYPCDNYYELSAQGYVDYAAFGGEKYNNLKNGYSKLPQHLASQLSIDSIKLNENVVKIDWSESQSTPGGLIKIRTLNSQNNAIITNYQAKYVITTVSLGVLKSSHASIFTPSLPSDKIGAINRLGFGTVNKIFYVFDEPVFTNNQAGIQFLWANDNDFTLDAEKNCNLNGNKFYKSFNTFLVPPKMKNVLFGFIVGKDSIFAESLSDECMISIFSEMLTRFFPQLNLPKPKAIVRSKWATNPLVQGSYSYPKVGSSIDDTQVLAKPVNNKLFFAGEATTNHIATVHGAYMSGIKAADSIISLLR